jgi:methylthioribose-1-phosphate isomerase
VQNPVTVIQSVRLDDENDTLVLLDQTILPNETNFLELKEMSVARQQLGLQQHMVPI